ncbi:MAG: hypothetical protein WCP46_00215 [Alphaproteobacteria bacterium]
MIAYKLFREMKDGKIASLFINKRARYRTNVWLTAENHPTKGFKERYGWHCTHAPDAPHLTKTGRVWYEVEIEEYDAVERPLSQGGIWYIANRIKILRKL